MRRRAAAHRRGRGGRLLRARRPMAACPPCSISPPARPDLKSAHHDRRRSSASSPPTASSTWPSSKSWRPRCRRSRRTGLSGRCPRQACRLRDKLAAAGRQPRARAGGGAARSQHKPAVILFTSGTEGEPKGVALSHAKICWPMSPRCAPISIFTTSDVLFNPLPVFHCFGLTVGMLLPLIAGVKVVCHPTPLQPREIVRRIRETRRHHPALHRHLHHPICPRRRAGRSRHVCAWRCAAPSGCATKPAPCSAANMASRFWKAMASPKPRPWSPPTRPRPTIPARWAG